MDKKRLQNIVSKLQLVKKDKTDLVNIINNNTENNSGGNNIYLIDGTVENFIDDLYIENIENIFKSICKEMYPIFINIETGGTFSICIKNIDANNITFTVNYCSYTNLDTADNTFIENWYYTTFKMTGDTSTGQYYSTEIVHTYEYMKKYDLA